MQGRCACGRFKSCGKKAPPVKPKPRLIDNATHRDLRMGLEEERISKAWVDARNAKVRERRVQMDLEYDFLERVE